MDDAAFEQPDAGGGARSLPTPAPDAEAVHDVLDEAPAAPVPPLGYALVAAFVGLVVCSNFANALWVKWQVDHPALLLALSSRVRFLVLTRVNGIDPVPYFLIGAARLAVAASVCYGIGRVFQERALTWFRRFLGMSSEGLDRTRANFDNAGWVLIPLFVGSNIICVLAGLSRIRPKLFAILLAIGIAGRLALYWVLAEMFRSPLEKFVDFSQKHQMKFIIGSVALVLLANAKNLRRGRG